jgi:hypothetical protein
LLIVFSGSIVGVLTAIGFHAQARRKAAKINNITANRHLSAETIAVQFPRRRSDHSFRSASVGARRICLAKEISLRL